MPPANSDHWLVTHISESSWGADPPRLLQLAVVLADCNLMKEPKLDHSTKMLLNSQPTEAV